MRRNKAAGFSLTEMMVVVAVSLTLMSLVGVFFSNLWLSSRRAIERTGNSQQALILMQEWQQTLNSTDPSGWSTDGTSFTSAQLKIHQDAEFLVITRGSTSKKVILPARAQCTFSIETLKDSAPLAALNIAWLDRRMGSSRERRAEILAHGKLL